MDGMDSSDSVDCGRSGETSWEAEPASESAAKDGAGETEGCGTLASLARNVLTSNGVAGLGGKATAAGVEGREDDATEGVFVLPAIDPLFRS